MLEIDRQGSLTASGLISQGITPEEVILEEIVPDGVQDTHHLLFTTMGDLSVPEQREFLRQAQPGLLESLLRENVYYRRFAIGLLLSAAPLRLLSPEARRELAVVDSGSDASIYPFRTGWFLCNSSESKLVESIQDRNAILVDETLLVKGSGYTAGLCLRTTATSEGTFFQGGWYSPLGETRGKIKEALDRGNERIGLNRGEWAYMRDITSVRTDTVSRFIMEKATHYAGVSTN